jgi:hypothetical protein
VVFKGMVSYPVMTIYVDELRDVRTLIGHGRPGMWCHMVSDDGLEPLHALAHRLGLPRRAFQAHPRHPHYDLTPLLRARALALGAVEVSTRQLAKILAEKEGRTGCKLS